MIHLVIAYVVHSMFTFPWKWKIEDQGSHFEPATGDFPPATLSKIADYFLQKNWELLGNIMDLH